MAGEGPTWHIGLATCGKLYVSSPVAGRCYKQPDKALPRGDRETHLPHWLQHPAHTADHVVPTFSLRVNHQQQADLMLLVHAWQVADRWGHTDWQGFYAREQRR